METLFDRCGSINVTNFGFLSCCLFFCVSNLREKMEIKEEKGEVKLLAHSSF